MSCLLSYFPVLLGTKGDLPSFKSLHDMSANHFECWICWMFHRWIGLATNNPFNNSSKSSLCSFGINIDFDNLKIYMCWSIFLNICIILIDENAVVWNGVYPTNISHSKIPNDHESTAKPCSNPLATSGDVYCLHFENKKEKKKKKRKKRLSVFYTMTKIKIHTK